MEPQQSAYHFYSFGIASNNKALDSETLFVYPIDIMPFGDGELDGRNIQRSSEGTDSQGQAYTARVNQNAAVEAVWARVGHNNRRTPPDVRRGERILLYRHTDDSELLFWSSCGMDDHKRRLETVIYTFSDTQDESQDATHPDNCYSLEVCTHTKQITLRTVKADGEPFAYVFQFNLKDGAVFLADDVGNQIQIDSAQDLIAAENAQGTSIHLDSKDIRFQAVKDLIGQVGRHIDLNVRGNARIGIRGDLSVQAQGSMRATGGQSAFFGCQSIGIQCTPQGGTFTGPSWNMPGG